MKQRRPLTEAEIGESAKLLDLWHEYQKEHPEASQSWLARQCGWKTQGAAHQYLNGLIPLNLEALIKICGVIGAHPVVVSPRLASSWPYTDSGVKEPIADYGFAARVKGLVLSAGNGHVTWEHEEIDNSHAFRRDWLQRNSINLKHCRIIDVRGDSMAPHLEDGDVVLINMDDKNIRSGEVYAIAVDGETRIKRLIKRADGGIEIRSDNESPSYPTETIPANSLDRIQIIGRKVWRGG